MRPKIGRLHSQAKYFAAKFRKGGERKHIDEAIKLDRRALNHRPPGHPMRPDSLIWLSNHLFDRYNQLGEISDLQEAIIIDREVLGLRPRGHPYQTTSLNNLALRLSNRYSRLGTTADLEEAILLCREALALCLESGEGDCSMYLNNLADHLSNRYDQLGEIKDLEEAIVLARDALARRPPGHPNRSVTLSGLANQLSKRYEQTAAMADLEEAIVLDQEALALRPPGHPGRFIPLSSLANHLSSRYEQLRAMVDLEMAIVLGREALDLCSPRDPGRAKYLNNLATYLHNRYKKLGEIEDIDDAIVLDQAALALRPLGHPERFMSLNNLAESLSGRYKKLRKIEDINRAIALAHDALALRPPGHPDHSLSLNNLANYLFARYNQLETMEDLDDAIVLARNALSLRSPGHPYRFGYLNDLARFLDTRFRRSSQLEDKEEIFTLYSEMSNTPRTISSVDLCVSRAWVSAAESFQHPTTLLAYETSLQLLIRYLATLPPLPQHLKILKDLTSSLALDAFSACLRNGATTKAVEFLEQGRGVFWRQLSRLRSPLDDVIASGSEGERLADKFLLLTSLIRNALNSPRADQHDRVWHLNIELQQIVCNIRGLRGLSHFLLPLTFPDLRQAAIGGPVIIVNASKYGCDALIVLLDRDPVHIPLKIKRDEVRALSAWLGTVTVRAKLMDVTKELVGILRELWKQVVSPIVDFLQTIHPLQSRIWWCPTAEFSVLPLHAAGAYKTGQRRLCDLYISSYTTTLAALIRTMRQDPPNSPTRRKRFIAIGQANPRGEKELRSVATELINVRKCVKRLATFKTIEGASSSISRVEKELNKNQWVHFACHGIPNRKVPFESAFALHDGRFTIEHIIRCELPNAQFAYLSACHTTVGDEDGPDEMIHLASAMQFAGFRSIIGTMWVVDDEQTNKITAMFYDNIKDESGRLNHTRAALALHKTMNELTGISFDQRILYVHFGA